MPPLRHVDWQRQAGNGEKTASFKDNNPRGLKMKYVIESFNRPSWSWYVKRWLHWASLV